MMGAESWIIFTTQARLTQRQSPQQSCSTWMPVKEGTSLIASFSRSGIQFVRVSKDYGFSLRIRALRLLKQITLKTCQCWIFSMHWKVRSHSSKCEPTFLQVGGFRTNVGSFFVEVTPLFLSSSTVSLYQSFETALLMKSPSERAQHAQRTFLYGAKASITSGCQKGWRNLSKQRLCTVTGHLSGAMRP